MAISEPQRTRRSIDLAAYVGGAFCYAAVTWFETASLAQRLGPFGGLGVSYFGGLYFGLWFIVLLGVVALRSDGQPRVTRLRWWLLAPPLVCHGLLWVYLAWVVPHTTPFWDTVMTWANWGYIFLFPIATLWQACLTDRPERKVSQATP